MYELTRATLKCETDGFCEKFFFRENRMSIDTNEILCSMKIFNSVVSSCSYFMWKADQSNDKHVKEKTFFSMDMFTILVRV